MNITPLDITQREFRRRLRGWDPAEVKAFLEGVADEMELLVKEAAARDERIQKLEGQVAAYQEREEALRKTLYSAQRLTEQLKETARREAELVRKEAELQAEKLLEQAHRQVGELQAQIADLKRQKQLFEAKLRAALKIHL
ncbi:MAG: DivIVA domain-containing protein, partial [candidate division NC10 bacterium]|nr:DivIVA domain-containing protein [candidate division NC10 bacterium]